MAECEVSLLCDISKFEPNGSLGISSNEIEKQTANEEVKGEENENYVINTHNEKETVDEEVNEDSVINTQNEKQTVDGNSVINTQNENEEEGSEEYPPLLSQGIRVSSANSVGKNGRNTRGWVNALKKPHRPFDFRVNEEKSDISTEDSVASSEGCSRMDVLKKPDWPFDVKVSMDSPEESVASSEVCSTDGASTKASRCFLVKVPRLDDAVLKEQIRLAELHLDEKTSSRDAIRVQIERRIQDNEYEHAVDEVKSARELVKLKRKEIDSHLSIIRVVKNAVSFDDMDSQEAFEQQLEAEEYLKTLKKELNNLKASVLRAETAAAVAQKKNHNEAKKVKELQARVRVENDACQAAYAQLRSLRTQHREKMREFFGYRDEATAASKYAYSKNSDRLCKNQVERFMKMWNENREFREDYVKSNAKSTVRRFGTLDGSSLGPNEKPLMLPRHVPVVNTVQKEIQEEIEQGISGQDVSNEVSTRKAEEMEQKEGEAELKQMGAELKAQMEAEKREKKRHKRLRLKERKKGAGLGPSEEPPSDVDQRAKGVDFVKEIQQEMNDKGNSEQSTSLKEDHHQLEENEQERKELKEEEENEQVLDSGTTPEKREKKRQKRLRNKERKKAAGEASKVMMNEETPEPEVQNKTNPEMPSDVHQQMMNEETPQPQEEEEEEEEEEEQEEKEQADSKEEKKNEEEEKEKAVSNEITSDALTEEETDEVIEQPPEALMAQMRAEIKAQLEAELRDKNRDKNLRKKERKKQRKNAPPTTTATNGRTFIWVLIIIILITLILFTPSLMPT